MDKKSLTLLVLILLASALLGSSVLTRGHFWGDDFAAYIMQAESIIGGSMDEFVTANSFTVTQSAHQIGPAAYPWGFPLMLIPAYMLFGLSPLALKLPGLITYLGFLVVFYFLIKRRFTPTLSLLAVSLFAFNPELLRFLDNILSDIPFLFLSTLTLLLADLHTHEMQPKLRRTLAILTGIAIFVAFFVRTQGLILLGSLLLFEGFRTLTNKKQRRQIVTDALLIVVIFLVLWSLSLLVFPGGQSSYFALYSGFNFDNLSSSIVSYSQLFGQFFIDLPAHELVFGIYSILFLIGLVARFKSDLLYIIYALLYLIVVWTWPEWQGYRFLFPILPLFIYFSIQGVLFILSKIPKKNERLGKVYVYTFLIWIVAFFLYISTSNAYNNVRNGRTINGPFDPVSIETYEFIKAETPAESVIVFFKPRALRLMTDRASLAITECERILLGDYLALSKKVGENLQIPPERIDECGLPLERIFQNRRFVVYQILKE